MARDDYHAVVYQILSYLYTALKNGKYIEAEKLSGKHLFGINEEYWKYIFYNLHKDGYITGITAEQDCYINGEIYIIIDNLHNCQITPKGIEYLSDNSFMKKEVEFFKDIKSIAPFV